MRKTCLGSSPDCCTHLCHAQLGNGTQKVGASFQGLFYYQILGSLMFRSVLQMLTLEIIFEKIGKLHFLIKSTFPEKLKILHFLGNNHLTDSR